MLLTSLLRKIEYTVSNGDPSACEVSSFCHDSRLATDTSLFVCIKGSVADGHDFALQAYSKGCRCFLAEKPLSLPGDACVLITGSTRIGLAEIAAEFYGYPSKKLHVVGITGTKGKTTSALTAYTLLNSAGISTGYIGSNGIMYSDKKYHTANTTPESSELQRHMFNMLSDGVRYLIMEVSSQAIYMDRIHGIKFETVAFTNLYEDHIGGAEHPTFEHYRDSKRRLFNEYESENVICNADDPYSEYMISQCKSKNKISFSAKGNESASIYAENVHSTESDNALGVSFDACEGDNRINAFVPMPGTFSVYNALLALAICKTAGIEISAAVKSLAHASAEGRFEAVPVPTGATFIIDYAHNGASLTAALTALKEYSPNRLICLFGSVGGRTFGRRRELALAASSLADLCILTSDNPDFEPPEDIIDDIASHFSSKDSCPFVKIPDRRDAIRFALANAEKGDIVLLAGKGHEDYQLVCGKKLPFSERSIIKEAILELTTI